MRVIIAGSRSIKDYSILLSVMSNLSITDQITEVLCGGASGVDRLGERWAIENSIPVKYYLADWEANGKSAGFIRNEEMAKNADVLVALWDGESRGTEHTLKMAKKYNLLIHLTIHKYLEN